MLLATYGFNNSHTKTIHVGLQRPNEGIFKFLVKLNGHNAGFISTSIAAVSRSHETHEYLSSDNRVKSNFVIKNITISFITFYGAKSIFLSYKEEEENSKRNLRKEENTHNSTPSAKK